MNATYCWWGGLDGPEYKEEGDSDDPKEVYSGYRPEYLLYEPWLEEPYGGDITPPVIEAPIMRPEQPMEGEDVEIVVKVIDTESGVMKVVLSYSADGGITWTIITMTKSYMNYYKAIIPAQAAGTTVLYKIGACDEAGNWAETPEYSYTVGTMEEPQPTPPPSGVVLTPDYGVLIFTVALMIIIIIALWRRRNE